MRMLSKTWRKSWGWRRIEFLKKIQKWGSLLSIFLRIFKKSSSSQIRSPERFQNHGAFEFGCIFFKSSLDQRCICTQIFMISDESIILLLKILENLRIACSDEISKNVILRIKFSNSLHEDVEKHASADFSKRCMRIFMPPQRSDHAL